MYVQAQVVLEKIGSFVGRMYVQAAVNCFGPMAVVHQREEEDTFDNVE